MLILRQANSGAYWRGGRKVHQRLRRLVYKPGSALHQAPLCMPLMIIFEPVKYLCWRRSTAKPFKRDGFPREFTDFTNAEEYTDWRFIYTQSTAALSAGAATQPANPETALSGTEQPGPGGPSGPVTPAKPGNRFALCESQLTIENAQCRESCGDLSGPACHACFAAASDAQRACLRN